MSSNIYLSVLRHVLTFGGGFLVANGTVDEVTATEVIGGVVAIVGTIWGIYEKLRRKPLYR